MEALVQNFNKLPRPETVPTGLPNHWYFSVRHVDLTPPGDLLHCVNPKSRYVHCEGPSQILSLPSLAAKANAIVPLLLQAFISGLGGKSPSGASLPAYAPWTWGTNCDSELSRAIEARLKSLGVKEELCTLEVGNGEDESISDETWSSFLDALKQKASGQGNTATAANNSGTRDQSTTNACTVCKKNQNSLSSPMKRCARCGGPRYCSRECQKADWKLHKKVCTEASEAASSENSKPGSSFLDKPSMSGFNHYNNVAGTIPAAQKLAKSINLTLPEPGSMEGIMSAIRRLVVTGNDTPENLELFFGPLWREGTDTAYDEARLSALMPATPGSPAHKLNSFYDQDCPYFSPRPATSDELEKIEKVRELQTQFGGILNQ